MRIWLPAAAFAVILNNRIALASEVVSSSTTPPTPHFVAGKIFINGDVNENFVDVEIADVYSCCAYSVSSTSVDECPTTEVTSSKRLKIGTMPQMTTDQALSALQSAITAWDGGSGMWPQMKLSDRIIAVRTFVTELKVKREEIVLILMHEIGKNRVDAEAEFDRTMQFIEKTIEYIQNSGEFGTRGWDASNGLSTRLFLSRAAVGIVLCMGPYNYPLNETYATLIPALLMGNVVILKLPTVGGLVHILTIDAFRKALPPGTINFISGRGRTTMPPLMESGKIDSLAFIGSSTAADRLIKAHPHPHRLKIFLQLEGKNMGIYMRDLFERGSSTTDDHHDNKEQRMDRILKETITGTLSYNGQRCTALKLLFVPKEYSTQFANMLAEKVESMSVGLPWERTNSIYSQITPLPYAGRVDYMKELIDDAIEKGARIVNKNGGTVIGDGESTLMVPAILYPVTPDMRVYEEEQFGPVIPIAPYDSLDEVIKYAREGKYGQQVSIFTSSADVESAQLIDRFSTVFGKININTQCGRSPDTAPFSGRRSSALGVMSVMNALFEFSIPTVVSYQDVDNHNELVKSIAAHSNFLQPKIDII
jgi:glyceraldehyde-3-phosphate dehydrogenase (NADP+)